MVSEGNSEAWLTGNNMHKLLYAIVLTVFLTTVFSAPAINIDWTPMGPEDTLYQPAFSTLDQTVETRPSSDSLALVLGGLVMLVSASLLRRLSP